MSEQLVSQPSSSQSRPPSPRGRRFGLVVPVKRVATAKSRLAPLGDEARRELVAAFAVDTVTAALACPQVARVLVVTDEVALALALREQGVLAIPDGGSGGLNEALTQGAAELVRADRHLRPVALCADLPALRTEDLSAVLDSVVDTVPPGSSSFVADAAGRGTTLYTAPDVGAFAPRFGLGSRQAHVDAGAVEVSGGPAGSVRLDVDTPEELWAALDLGVGPRTAWTVTRLGLGRGPAGRP